jgi:hypothetical protein
LWSPLVNPQCRQHAVGPGRRLLSPHILPLQVFPLLQREKNKAKKRKGLFVEFSLFWDVQFLGFSVQRKRRCVCGVGRVRKIITF